MARKHTDEAVTPRIRYHIYGIVRKNSRESVRIPSSYELAKMYGTTRRVVQYELERLIGEGVLIGRERIGTFTNPLCSYSRMITLDARMPLVGATYGSGDHFTYAHEGSYSLAEIYRALADRDCYVHDLRLGNKSLESMLRDIVSLNLDGVIWSRPRLSFADELFSRLNAAGIRVVVVGNELYPECAGVEFGYEEVCAEFARTFIAEGRERRIQISVENAAGRRVKALLTEHGLAPEQYTWNCEEDIVKTVAAFIRRNEIPRAIFCDSAVVALLYRELTAAGIDTRDACRLVALREFSGSTRFQGYIVHPPYAEAAAAAAELLFETDRGRRKCQCSFSTVNL